MRKMIRIVGPLAICLMLVAGFEAVADPGKGRGKGKGKNKGKGNKPAVTVVQPGHPAAERARARHDLRHRGGPPPWAPAHGYRAKHGGGYQTAYVAPYGIDGGHCNRKEVGMIIGGVTGGLIGSKITSKKDRAVGIIGGAVLGAIVGSAIGKSMDKADQHCVGQTLEHAPDSRAVSWSDPDNGARYQVTPVQTYQSASGGYCREYQTVSTVNGRSQETYGTACRQEDGAWKLAN